MKQFCIDLPLIQYRILTLSHSDFTKTKERNYKRFTKEVQENTLNKILSHLVTLALRPKGSIYRHKTLSTLNRGR